MSKIDLDEIEVSLDYFEEWKKVIAELRAARPCVEYLRIVSVWRIKIETTKLRMNAQ